MGKHLCVPMQSFYKNYIKFSKKKLKICKKNLSIYKESLVSYKLSLFYKSESCKNVSLTGV